MRMTVINPAKIKADINTADNQNKVPTLPALYKAPIAPPSAIRKAVITFNAALKLFSTSLTASSLLVIIPTVTRTQSLAYF